MSLSAVALGPVGPAKGTCGVASCWRRRCSHLPTTGDGRRALADRLRFARCGVNWAQASPDFRPDIAGTIVFQSVSR